MRTLLVLAAVALAGLAGCAKAPAGTPAAGPNPHVLIHTSVGDLTAEVYQDKAPKTAANFLQYVREGFYTDRQFYRIEKDFVVQGGGERQGTTGCHDPVVDEAKSSGLHNLRYTLSMARLPDADSATTEFFINTVDNTADNKAARGNLDPGGVSPDGYAVFGIVTTGRELVDQLNAVTVDPNHPPTFTITVVGEAAATSSAATAAPAGTVETDLITPGSWNVSAATDYSYAWLHNEGTAALTYTWSLTGPAGAALPAGWSATFLKPDGSLCWGNKDAAVGATLVTLTVPATQAAGDVPVELHAGGAVRAITVHVKTPFGAVAKPGEHANTYYTLRYPDGRVVSPGGQGNFCVNLAGPAASQTGNAVAGYGWGVIGLAVGETETLFVPPPLGYHYGGQFGDNVMRWTTTLKGVQQAPC